MRAGNPAGPGPWSAMVTFTTGSISAPVMVAGSPGDGQILVTWQAPDKGADGITTYDLRYIRSDADKSVGANWFLGEGKWSSGPLQYTITGLDNGVEYDVQVRAVRGLVRGPWSASTTATLGTTLASPTINSLTPGDGALVVAWSAPANSGDASITGYDLRYIRSDESNKADANWTVKAGIWSSGALQYTLGGLDNGVGYDLQVRGVNSVGAGAWSSSASGTPLTVPGRARSTISVTPGDELLTVMWSAPVDDGGSKITGYDLRYISRDAPNKDDANWTVQAGVWSSGALRYDLAGLTNGVGYEVQVRGVNSVGAGAWSASGIGKPRTTPEAPSINSLTPGEGTLAVAWSAPGDDGGADITSYGLRYIRSDAPDKADANWTEEQDAGSSASLEYTITGLTNGVEYAVRVIAVNDVGDGPPSDEATATPRETTPPELSTATVDGATLTLTYDEALDENSEPSPDAFSVTVGGTGQAVDGVAVEGDTVTLTLASAVTAEETVTVSYAAPADTAALRIRDLAGNAAASFSDELVTNNTPKPNSPATGQPAITGTAHVGETLTVDITAISDADGLPAESEFDYQWTRNDGSTDANIAGGTDSTYVLLAADAGKFIKVQVTFTDKNDYPETLTSAATAAVDPDPGPITGFTVVDASDQSVEGALADGGTLALDDPDGGSFGIRADLESGATIGSMSLQLTGAKTHAQTENIAPYSLYGDSGGNLSGESLPVGEYTLTATAYSEARLGGNVLGTLEVSFTVTETATQQPNTPATGLPTISGTAQVGETLTVDTSGIDDADGIGNATFSYQWIAGTTDISGATGSSYAPLVADLDKTIKVRVSFMDGASNVETLTSEATATVIAAVAPLTARFQEAPDEHDGTGAFTFRIAFSEPISISYKTLRDDSLELTNGSATKARRVNGQSDLWEITVEPDSDAAVTVVLPITGDCSAQGAVCSRAGGNELRPLSNRSELTVPGPAAANSPATGAPSISGTAQVGETLTVDTSGIDDADGMSGAVFSYQWLADGVDIAGATSDTYTLVEADVGKAVKVRVIFNDDDDNEETLTSVATAAVAAETAAPDAPRSLNVSPDDTGTLDVSWEAPASDGGSDITGYKVQWKSGSEDYDGSAGSTRQAEITDPASRTHTITGLTDGVEYTVRVIAFNDVGDGPPSDEATGTPRETTPPELATATVDGTTLTLTYDEDLDENSEPSADAFSVTAGSTGRAVDGVSVSGSSVILTLGSAVASGATVTVSYTVPTDYAAPRIQDEAGNPAASFSDQDVENNTPPPANTPATGAPTISGTVRVGETLTAETSAIADADGMSGAVFIYQWLADDAEIAGATSDTYTLVDADLDKAVKVRVIFTDNADNQETLTSEATVSVEPKPNSPATGTPTISGTAQVGETLTAETRDIEDDDGLSKAVFIYQWLADDADIAGATSGTYTPVADDIGKAIKVKVSFRDDRNHQESLTSAATAAVTAAADDSAVWSATLTVGSIAGYRGFWKDVGMGELTREVFTLDGVDYTVKVLADSDGPQFYLTLDKALPVGFTLQVGAATLSSQGASIREFSSGATQYGWATNQGAVLADVDTVEVSLTLDE